MKTKPPVTKPAALQKFQMPEQPKQTLIDQRTEPLLKQSRSITAITSEDHFTVTGTIIPRLDEAMKWIDAVSTPFVQAMDRLHKLAVGWKKTQLSRLDNEKRRLLDLRMKWRVEQEEIKRKASEKLALGLQKQEQRELLRQAKFEEKHGNAEAAEVLRQHAEGVPLPQVAPAAAVPAQVGFYLRERWIYKIVDPAAVEREYCTPDDKLIRPVVESLGPNAKISGIVIERETKEHSRAVNA